MQPTSLLMQELARHFGFLQLAEGTLKQFAQAYESDCDRFDPNQPFALAQLHSNFLLSTDFFQYGADQARTVRL